jgi:hypothetical protein
MSSRFLCTARASWQNLSTRFADYKEKSDCIYVGSPHRTHAAHGTRHAESTQHTSRRTPTALTSIASVAAALHGPF